MFYPTTDDIKKLHQWEMTQDPLAAIKDYKKYYELLRWLKPSQWFAHYRYYKQRAQWIGKNSFQKYFKEADRTLQNQKWRYLQLRKSWYQIPLGWEVFTDKKTKRILDFGCGDGDLTFRVADYIKNNWKVPHKIEINGIDLSASRIKNAQKLCKSPHKDIKIKFKVIDGAKGLPYSKYYFDYTLVAGVFEILSDTLAQKIAHELGKVSKRGIYIEDLADAYPGGKPRENLESLFTNSGFKVRHKEMILSEPFSLFKQPDPCQLWPILKVQILFLERE